MKRITIIIAMLCLLIALAGCGKKETKAPVAVNANQNESAESATSEAAEYIVHVVDQNGDPVPGAYVNFCTDTACLPSVSDDSGVIAFSGEPYAYHLQILKVPEGYSFDKDFEAYTEEPPGETTIAVTKD